MKKLKENIKESIMKELRKYHAEDAELMFNFYYDMSRPKIEEYSKI